MVDMTFKHFFAFFSVLLLAGASSANLTSGLIAYYNGSNLQNVVDANNWLANTTTGIGAYGWIGNGYLFNNVSNSHDNLLNNTASLASINTTNGITMAVMMRPNASNNAYQRMFLLRHTDGYGYGFQWRQDNGRGLVAWYLQPASGNAECEAYNASFNNAYAAGSWWAALAIFNSSGTYLYINNTLQGANNLGAACNGTIQYGAVMSLIQIGSANSEDYNGILDEASIWNRSLTETDRTDWFNNMTAKNTYPFPAG